MPGVMLWPVGRSYQVPQDLHLGLLIKGLFSAEESVSRQKEHGPSRQGWAGSESGPSTLQDRTGGAVMVGWL